MSRILSAVFIMLFLSPALRALDTKVFGEFGFRYTTPGEAWSWMSPPPGSVCALSDKSGRMLFITVEPLNGGPRELSEESAKSFEEGFFSSDEIEKVSSSFLRLNGVPTYQAGLKFKKDGRMGFLRLQRKNDFLYRFDVFSPAGGSMDVAEFNKILNSFEFLAPSKAALPEDGSQCRPCSSKDSLVWFAFFVVAAFILVGYLLRKKGGGSRTGSGKEGGNDESPEK